MGNIRLGQAATPAQLAQLGNFNGLPLREMLGALKSTDVNVLVKELGIDKALSFVAALVKKSGQLVSSALDTTYDKYKGTSQWSLGSWADELALISPGVVMTYAYLSGNSQHRAVAELEGIKQLGAAWINQSTKTWFGGSSDPTASWVDEYDVIDRVDSDAVGAVFGQVVASEARVIDLTVKIKKLPEHVILASIDVFWSSIKSDLNATQEGIRAILAAIAEMARLLGRIIVGTAGFFEKFPLAGLIALGAAGFLIWKLS